MWSVPNCVELIETAWLHSPSETFVRDGSGNNSKRAVLSCLAAEAWSYTWKDHKVFVSVLRPTAIRLTLLGVVTSRTGRAVSVWRTVRFLYPATCRDRKGETGRARGEQGIWLVPGLWQHTSVQNTSTDSTLRAGTVILMEVIFAQIVLLIHRHATGECPPHSARIPKYHPSSLVTGHKQWVILRRVSVTNSVVKKNTDYCILWVCVYRLSYPAFNAHAPNFIAIRCLSGWTTFIILRIQRYMNVFKSSCKAPSFLSEFNDNSRIIGRFFFFKNREISNFMKIRSVGVELLRATRQAWRSARWRQCWLVLRQIHRS